MLFPALSEIEPVLRAATPQSASALFFDILARAGATYLQTRLYRRPMATLTSSTHWAAGGVVSRFAPKHWVGSSAFNYICFERNPLLGAIRESRTRYRFSDFANRTDPTYGAYWDAMSEARIGDALCATSYGADRSIASLHLGFERTEFAPGEVRDIQMAGLILTERLMEFALPSDGNPLLTERERDCLAFVAEGKTDWEIARLLGISEATTRFHLNNARRKLGAVNRAQAVARFAMLGLL
jgi:DNA-binding CsgD family transcriptional regulator